MNDEEEKLLEFWKNSIKHNPDLFIETITKNRVWVILDYIKYAEEEKFDYLKYLLWQLEEATSEEDDDNKYKQEVKFLQKYLDLIMKEAKVEKPDFLSIFKDASKETLYDDTSKPSYWSKFCELFKWYFWDNFNDKCIEIVNNTPVRNARLDKENAEKRAKLEQERIQKEKEDREFEEVYQKAIKESDYLTLARLLDVDEKLLKDAMIESWYNIKE